jgi:hypothetical protein
MYKFTRKEIARNLQNFYLQYSFTKVDDEAQKELGKITDHLLAVKKPKDNQAPNKGGDSCFPNLTTNDNYTPKKPKEKWQYRYNGTGEWKDVAPSKPRIEPINMATYNGNRETAIEIMVENKLNELVEAVNTLLNSEK